MNKSIKQCKIMVNSHHLKPSTVSLGENKVKVKFGDTEIPFPIRC